LRLAEHFKKIIAVEPDSRQLDHLKTNVNNNQFAAEKISIFQSSIQNFEYNSKFQFILCSHIIQHLPKMDVEAIFKKLHDMLQTHGILVIFTTHSRQPYNKFLIQHSHDEEYVSEEKFEQSFNSFNDSNQLCFQTHKYSREYLFTLLENSGFEILDDRIYHIPSAPAGAEREMNADTKTKEKNGMDQIVICTKL